MKITVDAKLKLLSDWFRGQAVEYQELKGTIPNQPKYQEILDNIQKLCVDIQEETSKLLK